MTLLFCESGNGKEHWSTAHTPLPPDLVAISLAGKKRGINSIPHRDRLRSRAGTFGNEVSSQRLRYTNHSIRQRQQHALDGAIDESLNGIDVIILDGVVYGRYDARDPGQPGCKAPVHVR